MASSTSVLLAHGPTDVPAEQAPTTRAEIFLPWIVAAATTGFYAFLVEGPERWLALGLAIGAGLAWHTNRRMVHAARAAVAQMEDDFRADADGRVAMVIRQFQWAVNDVSALQVMLQKTKDAARRAEDRARSAEHQVRLLQRELYVARNERASGAGEPALDPRAANTAGEFISS